ncbi:helix-turn-helix domain-containing protein [Citricoccus nitrophenolicus]|uniref:helix-turn-helix domain-containing protein n=1 Tax=Citricoccus nitrophenolicus TaxID=863575 RepID=UPI0039B4C91C
MSTATEETTSTTTPEPVLRVRDVAEHLDCGTDSVYQLIAAGNLRAIRVGRVIRVPESALAEFIAGGTGRR